MATIRPGFRLRRGQNLADLTSPAAARESLGLGTAATRNEEAFGIGRTWQDYTGNRNPNVIYTNYTGREMFLSIEMGGSGTTFSIEVDGVTVDRKLYVSNSNEVHTLKAIVPNGSTYKSNSAGAKWLELR